MTSWKSGGGTAEIAEAADVAVSTVFKHFDSKEAIAFARDPAIEAELERAVTQRPAGVSIARSLRNFLIDSPALVAGPPEFVALVRSTPALTAYSDRMWSRHARAVAQAIEAETSHPASDMHVRAWAPGARADPLASSRGARPPCRNRRRHGRPPPRLVTRPRIGPPTSDLHPGSAS